MMRLFSCSVLIAVCASNALAADGDASAAPQADIEVSYDESANVARVSIPVRDGCIRWGELFRGLARARGFDDEALDGLWSGKSIRVTGLKGRMVLAGVDQALGPGIQTQLAVDGETGQDRLEITLDRRAMLASERRFKQRLKGWFGVGRLAPPGRYGLKLDDHWKEAPADKSLVVLVHGVQSTADRIGAVLEDVRKAGYPCGTFDYPNDQPIEESAQFLAEQLAKVAEEQPERKLALITHSMGGLVARAAIEDRQLDPGNVRQLIMVAPPSHGSLLAHFAFAFDLWEYLGEAGDQKLSQRFFSAVEDGLGEAPNDLRPGSPFLEQLNSRPRNPEVRYTILLGTAGPLSEASLQGLRRSVKTAGDRNRYARFLGSKLDGYLADLDEVVRGKGDGAVALKRGGLEGVSDMEVLEFDHFDLSGPPESPGAKLIREALLRRL